MRFWRPEESIPLTRDIRDRQLPTSRTRRVLSATGKKCVPLYLSMFKTIVSWC